MKTFKMLSTSRSILTSSQKLLSNKSKERLFMARIQECNSSGYT